VAMVLTIAAFGIVLDLTLRRLDPGDRAVRRAAIAAFVACPLLYGAGDSLRWYPVFAALAAVFVAVWSRAGRPTILAGALLGLAASTSFLAVVPGVVMMMRRYAFQRRFERARDVPFIVATLMCASPGLITFWNAATKAGEVRDGSALVAPLTLALGFFGGGRLGLSPAPAMLPYMAVATLAIAALALRWLRADRDHAATARSGELARAAVSFVALSAIVMAALGLSQPRALLFVAPFVCAAIVLALPRAPSLRVVVVAALALPTTLVVATTLPTTYPFKRNLAIPMTEVMAWIDAEAPADAAFVTSEPVVEYLLDRRGRCVVGRMGAARACGAARLAAAGAVVVLRDHTFEDVPQLRDAADRAARERRPVLTATFGLDRDAALKSRLTGVALTPWILRAELWR
ncbi:MAG: hypothetical protein JNL07_01315, partial [Rhodospirillales bacterium]|nr:hypothetical protein [Rhodospirillales bacterium]